ncbi:ATP-dependent RNA helicase DBP7 [Nakaseomyces bracarensis]|uniref:ATP-dependent RNA helicase n=1 Tax=Nakaseomyces bracarensis TaxID=273131 RepID=A0ABR4NMB3_9SACH
MSDDESMVLNFSTDSTDATPRVSSKITGGRWKDRRKMQQSMGHSEKREKPEDSNFERGSKRAKVVDMGTDKKPQEMNINQQIVSSLFTSNREVATAENKNKYNSNEVITPSNAPLLDDSFNAIGVNDTLITHLNDKMKINKPTNIQKLVIPQIMKNNNRGDLFIHAQTGSGKTLSYLLPLFSSILDMGEHVDRKSGCFALIIAPTRELASQIYDVASNLANCCHYLVPCLLIGGERKKSEKARLRKGCNFIIGTPGRILDHFQNTKVIKEQMQSSLRYIVLDEGDKLMELGFDETISQILDIIKSIDIDTRRFPKLPHNIQHLLCSATQSSEVAKLGKKVLTEYKVISNGKNKSESNNTFAPDQLLQKIVICPPKLRLVTLAGVLDQVHSKGKHLDTVKRTIVFLSCADSVDFHYEVFSASDGKYRNLVGESARNLIKGSQALPSFELEESPNVICYKLHGSLTQQMRTMTLKHFATDNDNTKGKHLILFCTDVASRGLDLPDVSTVIEFDPPFAVEDHLHRIGRTARAGKKGESVLFLLPGEEEGYLDHIQKYHPKGWELLKSDKDVLMPAFSKVNVVRNDKSNEKTQDKENLWDSNVTTWHLNVERRILEDQYFKDLATKGYISHIRAYATHISSEKQFFNIKCMHLGHLAKSFGLRERPKAMGLQSGKDNAGSSKPKKEGSKNKMWRLARLAAKQVSEEFNY